MNMQVTLEDVKNAMFDMAPYKAPGPDGMHAGFYQLMWNTVGETVYVHILNFLKT